MHRCIAIGSLEPASSVVAVQSVSDASHHSQRSKRRRRRRRQATQRVVGRSALHRRPANHCMTMHEAGQAQWEPAARAREWRLSHLGCSAVWWPSSDRTMRAALSCCAPCAAGGHMTETQRRSSPARFTKSLRQAVKVTREAQATMDDGQARCTVLHAAGRDTSPCRRAAGGGTHARAAWRSQRRLSHYSPKCVTVYWRMSQCPGSMRCERWRWRRQRQQRFLGCHQKQRRCCRQAHAKRSAVTHKSNNHCTEAHPCG